MRIQLTNPYSYLASLVIGMVNMMNSTNRVV